MTLYLELPTELEERLKAEAREHDLSVEEYAMTKLPAATSPEPPGEETAGEGILRLSRETFGTLRPDELEKLPIDIAVNHDHYIHGAPRVRA